MVKIILATYMGEKYITEQIESVMKSEYKDFHIYVFDDCSSDGTAFSLEVLERKYKDNITVVINESNKGHMKNFLEGLHTVAQGRRTVENYDDYYMFCDQDDIWFPKKISVTLSHMKTLEEKYGKDMPMLVFTDARVLNEKGESIESFMKQSHYDIKQRDPAHILMENKGMGCTMLMNHALASKIKEIPEYARYHDWWVMLMASVLGKTAYINMPTMFYRQHDKNEVGVSGFSRYVGNRLKGITKQKKQLVALYRQAEEFYEMFAEEITAENKEILEAFIGMQKQNWFKRRKTALKYGFLKSGVVRNIGLMMIL